MLYCPNCKQEYRDGIQECADCMVPLLDQKAFEEAERAANAGNVAMAAVFRAEDEQTLDLMARAIAVHHIPYEVRSNEKTEETPESEGAESKEGEQLHGHFLIVPAEMGQKVIHIIDQGLPMVIAHGEGKDRVYRMFDQEREEEIRNPPLLQEPTAQLVARGDEIIDNLIEFVARGNAATKNRAAYVLTCLGDSGVFALIKLLKVAIEKEEQDTAMSLIHVVRKEIDSGKGWEEFSSLFNGSPLTKILALQAITALENVDAFPSVLPLLKDEDADVRDEADNTLCTLTDQDMGFDTEASTDERNAVISQWEAWWAGRKNG